MLDGQFKPVITVCLIEAGGLNWSLQTDEDRGFAPASAEIN